MNDKARAIISVIIECVINGEREIFIQTRWKPHINKTYSGLLEIPAGGIEGYESVYDAAKREVKEETGLDVTHFIDGEEILKSENIRGDISQIFKPFLCQQMIQTRDGLPWIGFVFRCEVEGEMLSQSEEAKDPKFISVTELKHILETEPESFFPLQYPVLKYYIEQGNSGKYIINSVEK